MAPVGACERADVEYYLERGFTHEQVVRLCSEQPLERSNAQPATSPVDDRDNGSSATTHMPTQQGGTPAAAGLSANVALDDQIYFKTVIEADKVDLASETLAYTRKGCIKYGEEDLNGFQETACVTVQTTLELAGLRVIRAQKGIPLVAERELVVEGKIQREILDLHRLKRSKQKAFLSEYSLSPPQINIPTRSGVDPRDVAVKLRVLSGQ